MAASSGAIRAGQAFVELFADDSKLVKGLRSAQARLSAWGKTVRAIGLGINASAGAAFTSILGSSVLFAKAGDALDEMSDRTGWTIEQLSGLSHAADLSGASLQGVEGSIRVLTRKIAGGDKAFAQLGLSVDALRQMTPQDQFYAVADALSQVRDPSMRAALSMQVLGKSATELLPLLKNGSAGLRDMHQEAAALGLVMTTAEGKSAAAYSDALDTLWSQLKMVSKVIGAAVAPVLTDILTRSQPIIASVIAWIRASKPLIANVFAITAAVAGLGAGLIGLGYGMQGMAFAISPLIKGLRLFAGGVNLAIKGGAMLARILGTSVMPLLKTIAATLLGVGKAVVAFLVQGAAAGASALGGALGMLLTPIGLVGAAIGGLGAYVVYASGVFGDLLEAGTTVWNGLKTTAVAAWGAIGQALASGNLAAAGRVAWTGLQLEWLRGVNALKDVWTKFTTFLKQVFWTAVLNIADAWSTLAESVLNVWREIERTATKAGIDLQVKLGLMDDTTAHWATFGVDQTVNAAKAQDQAVRDRINADLQAARDRRMHGLDAAAKQEMEARATALQSAQAEFDAAVAAVKAAGETPAASTPDLRERVLDAAVEVKQRAAGGTFSGFAGRMFDFGTTTDHQADIAKHTEDTAKHVGQIARHGVKARLTYAA